MKRFVFVSIAASAILAASAGLPVAAAFADDDGTATDSAQTVAEVLASQGTDTAATAAAVQDTTAGVSTAVPGTSLKLSLPNADVVGKADGMTVVDGGGDSTATMQTLASGGSRVAFVANNPSDPSSYSVTYSGASSLTLNSDGGVSILDADGQPLATVDTPWATDANGKAVPTHFAINGLTLTQVVDLSSPDIAFPVVADPVTRHWWGTEVTLRFSHGLGLV